MTADMLRKLLGIVEHLGGTVNAVRFMWYKQDVDYADQANEVEVSVLNGRDLGISYFSWDLPDGEDWIETV